MAFEQKKEMKRKSKPALHLPITEEENDMVVKECKTLGISRSNFIRLCVTDYFFKQEFEVGK